MLNFHGFFRMLAVPALTATVLAQVPPAPAPLPCPAAPERPAPVYAIAPNDVIVIRAVNAEELSDKPFRVEADGQVSLPLVGRVCAAGLTVEQLEVALTGALKTFIRDPQVAVSIVERAKTAELQQSVWLVGAFRTPGMYVLTGRDLLADVLARSGGLAPNAGRRIRLTRRADQGSIPLAAAVRDPNGNSMSVEIPLSGPMELASSADNVELKPFDLLTAAKLEMVYVTGELMKTGAFALEDRESFSVAQIVSLAGGLGREAKARQARILRPVLNTSRRAEIPIDIEAILAGRASDFHLMPNDILVVPRSAGARSGIMRTLVYAVPAVATSLIYVALR